MAASHTPGPWTYGTGAVSHERADIANIYGVLRLPTEDGLGQGWGVVSAAKPSFLISQEENTANALLIVAAPDMFDALRGDPQAPAQISPLSWLRSLIDDCRKRGPSDDCEDPAAWCEMLHEVDDLHRKGLAAIAKTEGRDDA